MKTDNKNFKRQTQLVFVNKLCKNAVKTTIDGINKRLQNIQGLKGVSLFNDTETIPSVTPARIPKMETGKLHSVENNRSLSLDDMFLETVNFLKYGVLHMYNDGKISDTTFSKILADTFKNKSIDLIVHHNGLLVSKNEILMIQNARNTAQEKQKIERSVFYRIHPDEHFELTKDYFAQLVKMYGNFDATALVIMQRLANDTQHYVVYDLLTKKSYFSATIEQVGMAIDVTEKQIKISENFLNIMMEKWFKETPPTSTKTNAIEKEQPKLKISKEETEVKEFEFEKDANYHKQIDSFVAEMKARQKIEDETLQNEDVVLGVYEKYFKATNLPKEAFEEFMMDCTLKTETWVKKVDFDDPDVIKGLKQELGLTDEQIEGYKALKVAMLSKK